MVPTNRWKDASHLQPKVNKVHLACKATSNYSVSWPPMAAEVPKLSRISFNTCGLTGYHLPPGLPRHSAVFRCCCQIFSRNGGAYRMLIYASQSPHHHCGLTLSQTGISHGQINYSGSEEKMGPDTAGELIMILNTFGMVYFGLLVPPCMLD